ncbi:transposase [uncultured Luteimonas sp.]|uniref:transposase n=1 Tax=uncultured Luteimonas sp. TaxID=453144 RepID=UPI0026096792|nr:transposase [uncultured Luteimonas sp.]
MPRQPRIDLPGIPQHIVQRGNDRQPCFFADVDCVRYLQDLRHRRREYCSVHAYVLMTNHVHLLITPMASGQVACLMQSLRRGYVRYINKRYRRTGTLWEGRYKSCPVMDDDYFLRCQRYIDLNPLRARRVEDPAHYRWSSHSANTHPPTDPLHAGARPCIPVPPVRVTEGQAGFRRRGALKCRDGVSDSSERWVGSSLPRPALVKDRNSETR